MSTGAAEKSQSAFQGLPQPSGIGSKLRRVLVLGSMLVGCGLLLLSPSYLTTSQNYEIHVDPLSPESYSHLTSHCSSISPISHSEFASRQANLASALHSLGASAYIAEPGANTQFFGNFSKAQWSLSERPLLLIIAPVVHEGEVQSQVTILSPKVWSLTLCLLRSFDSADENLLPSSRQHVRSCSQYPASTEWLITLNGPKMRTHMLLHCRPLLRLHQLHRICARSSSSTAV